MDNRGFLAWATSIRTAMTNDPGRKFFQDQIQTHGFIFLNDYLENIIAGPKQDPIIELVKTPGRKKAATVSKTPISRLRTIVLLSPEDDSDVEKENVAPLNGFHKVLLQAKQKQDQDPTIPRHLSNKGHENVLKPIDQTLPANPPEPLDELQLESIYFPPIAQIPTHSEPMDLSVIAEDDETAERSHLSLQSAGFQISSVAKLPIVNEDFIGEETGTTNDSVKHSTASVAKTRSRDAREQNVESSSSSSHHPNPIGEEDGVVASHPASNDSHTAPLPDRPHTQPPVMHANDVMTAPLPTEHSSTPSTFDIPLRDAPPPSSPKGLSRKPSNSMFPTLPAPQPLRKSIRVPREPSTGAGLTTMGSMTPGAALGGKRSSWLVRAREAKAMGHTGKTSTLDAAVTGSGTATRTSGKRKSDEVSGTAGDGDRQRKVPKLIDGDGTVPKSTANDVQLGTEQRSGRIRAPSPHVPTPPPLPPPPINRSEDQVTPTVGQQEGMLDRLKRTVEGLGARVGKTMSKSLGGAAAATWLAEARAAAEAKVAEREKNDTEERVLVATPPADGAPQRTNEPVASDNSPGHSQEQPRLSVSDLLPLHELKKKAPSVFLQGPTSRAEPSTARIAHASKDGVSATPSNSPPRTGTVRPPLPPLPVFSKPPPVFIPPPQKKPSDLAESRSFPSPIFTRPPPAPSTLMPPPPRPVPLSGQSSVESVMSDRLFDARDDAPAWLPNTQDTEYSSGFDSQPGVQSGQNCLNDDDDDSWPLDEKLSGGPFWTFGAAGKDDSLTWSTDPTTSTRAAPVEDTGIQDAEAVNSVVPGAFDAAMDENKHSSSDESDIDDIGHAEVSTVNLVEPQKLLKSESQFSLASSASSNAGPLGQAGKLVKKGKTEVKSLQRAAVAAKKQQEEMDKKAARLKDMENRRQLAQQRKADEEKARAVEVERKIKEEGERRKREREEHTDKRVLKSVAKKDEEIARKRKLVVEIEKKSEVKKPPSKIAKPNNTAGASKAVKPTGIVKQPAASSSALPSSAIKAAAKGKAKANKVLDDDMVNPSQMVQSQMTTRLKLQLEASKAGTVPAEIASENIELPDIHDEYSDSEDEDRPRSFDPPEWAQSPELRQALQMQSTVNPDEIFGSVGPLRMEEMFRTKTSRFRARTSSANWAGSDGLTVEEEREYVRRMGFQ